MLPVLRVVIGGMASRHALPVDRLDDLQLAVETLFREEPLAEGDVTLTVCVVDEVLRVTLAGLTSQLVRRTLSGMEGGVALEKEGRAGILRLLMDSLVDGYRTADGMTADCFLVEMEKRIS
jgi:hypothetical protein